MRESVIEDYLVGEVKKLSGEIRKLKWIARNGAPDRLVGFPHKGCHFLIELKRPGKKPTKAQYREHERLRGIGFSVYWTSTKKGVDDILRRYV